jgi:hypothetical protein
LAQDSEQWRAVLHMVSDFGLHIKGLLFVSWAIAFAMETVQSLMRGLLMNDKLESSWKGYLLDKSICSVGNCPERLRKTKKNLSQDSWCHSRDSNRAPTK